MIKIENLVKNYDGFQALKGISFEVKEGDIFGFIGPNGAGKTTTFRILATLLDPDSGTVRVNGFDIIDEPQKVRRSIGFMPDFFGVYERLTVREYLDFFAACYGLRRKERQQVVNDVMDLTDLMTLKDKVSSTLSKGMKQRLCLAKTLVHNPQVLILDEPAAGLDPRARIEFRALLKELRNMGKTILISSHILTELSDVCNAVAIIEKGSMVAWGGIEQIKKSLTTAKSVCLKVLDQAEEAQKLLQTFPGISSITTNDNQLNFQFSEDDAKLSELICHLATKGISIIGLHEEKTDLEDLFMKLTKGEVT
ncbi:MAG: ABC transporter ATP-binding protein [Planctomycetota bacterium]